METPADRPEPDFESVDPHDQETADEGLPETQPEGADPSDDTD